MKKEKTLTIQKEYDSYGTKTFRLPTELIDTLDKVARDNNTSMNKVVVQCLEFALDNIEDSDLE